MLVEKYTTRTIVVVRSAESNQMRLFVYHYIRIRS